MVWLCRRILFMFELWSKPTALEILNLPLIYIFFPVLDVSLPAHSVQIRQQNFLQTRMAHSVKQTIIPSTLLWWHFWFWFNAVTLGQILDRGKQPLICRPKDSVFKDPIGGVGVDTWTCGVLLSFVLFFPFFTFWFDPFWIPGGAEFHAEEALANGYKTLGEVLPFCGPIFLKLLLSRNDRWRKHKWYLQWNMCSP